MIFARLSVRMIDYCIASSLCSRVVSPYMQKSAFRFLMPLHVACYHRELYIIVAYIAIIQSSAWPSGYGV